MSPPPPGSRTATRLSSCSGRSAEVTATSRVHRWLLERGDFPAEELDVREQAGAAAADLAPLLARHMAHGWEWDRVRTARAYWKLTRDTERVLSELLQLADATPAGMVAIEVLRKRMGWSVPWYSSYGTSFNDDMGLTSFGLSVLLRDGDEVFRSYFTTARGVDRLRLDFSLLDLTPYGRQEQWEDSPEGWPQDPTMSWLRLHDEY